MQWQVEQPWLTNPKQKKVGQKRKPTQIVHNNALEAMCLAQRVNDPPHHSLQEREFNYPIVQSMESPKV